MHFRSYIIHTKLHPRVAAHKISDFIEEGVHHGFFGRWTKHMIILKEPSQQIKSLWCTL